MNRIHFQSLCLPSSLPRTKNLSATPLHKYYIHQCDLTYLTQNITSKYLLDITDDNIHDSIHNNLHEKLKLQSSWNCAVKIKATVNHPRKCNRCNRRWRMTYSTPTEGNNYTSSQLIFKRHLIAWIKRKYPMLKLLNHVHGATQHTHSHTILLGTSNNISAPSLVSVAQYPFFCWRTTNHHVNIVTPLTRAA